jgi:hypothetical protein
VGGRGICDRPYLYAHAAELVRNDDRRSPVGEILEPAP